MQRAQAAAGAAPPALALVYPCDVLALQAAARIADLGLARPLLVGPREGIERAAGAAGVDVRQFEIVEAGAAPGSSAESAAKRAATGAATGAVTSVDTGANTSARASAERACMLARGGAVAALMKGSLHSDELLRAVAHRHHGLHGKTRIGHTFVFDLPRYPKLLALTDCVVNENPKLPTKRDLITTALQVLAAAGVDSPKVGIVAAVETVNPSMPATLDAQALVALARQGAWPGAVVEGPFGFDNAISAESARIKGMSSQVAGDADLLLMPDLNAGNMLYKSFIYIGGGACAGLVTGTLVPVVLTSRADTLESRIASVALAVLAAAHAAPNAPT